MKSSRFQVPSSKFWFPNLEPGTWNLELLLCTFCLLSSSACQRATTSTKAAEPPPVAVSVVKVQAEPFAVTIPVTGTLASTSRVDVKAETIGRVARFDKEEGDAVSAGETVVWLDEEDRRLALCQAETAVAVSEAAIEKTRVMQAHYIAEHERARHLLQSGGITDKDLKSAEVAERDARAQALLTEAQLAQARAALEVARKRLRDCQIHAPVSGRIQTKFVRKGAYVEAPTALFTLVDNRRLELESPVASAGLGPIRAGQKVTFAVNSYPGETFEGRVVEVGPAVDPQTRSAKVRVQVDNSGSRLKAGLFAQGEILTGVDTQAIVIPASALYREDSTKASYVFVVEQDKAARRAVRTGRQRNQHVEITQGLKPGDTLITEQNIQLADGVRVQSHVSK